MDSDFREIYAEMLGLKPHHLPEQLIDAFDRFKFAHDRISGGPLNAPALVLIAQFAGVELPKPKPRITDELPPAPEEEILPVPPDDEVEDPAKIDEDNFTDDEGDEDAGELLPGEVGA